MLRFNFTQVKQDFQSMYNLHELLISLAVQRCETTPTFEFLTFSAEPSSSLFPDYTNTPDFLA